MADEMIASVARFIIRPAEDGRGDLVLGSMFKDRGPSILKPGVVYEIKEILGVLSIVPLGEGAIGIDSRDSLTRVSWSNEVGYILDVGKGVHLLTKEELLHDRGSRD